MASSCVCKNNPLRISAFNCINGYETSSKHSHYYENVIDHSFVNLHVKRNLRKDLNVRDPVILDLNKTTNSRIYEVKYWEDKKTDEYRMNKFSLTDKPNLKYLHEMCMKSPVMPRKFFTSTTAEHYSIPKENRAPLSIPDKSPIESSICPIRALGRDEFPSVPLNSPGSVKHLDIFVSTSQLAHTRFTIDQQNGVARKDVPTFYDLKGTPKCRGFGPKKTMPIGSYFHRDKTEPDRVRMRSYCRIPYLGKTSEYNARFGAAVKDSIANKSIIDYHDREIQFPTIFPVSSIDVLSTPAMYCTENCHIGTGWPVRASVDLGKVRGTF